MSIFPLTKDIQKFLERAIASLERFDQTVGEAQLLIRNMSEAVTEVRQIVQGVQRGLKG